MRKVWRYGEKMPHQSIAAVYFMQNSAELRGAGYDILEWFADLMRSPIKLLEKYETSGSYKKA